jgi:transcriptional regulator with XRE-family HTH domain
MPLTIRPRTGLSLELFHRMGEMGVSISELAERTEVVYETVRRIVSGQQPPSKRLLVDICNVLKLDFDRCNEMLVAEKIKAKFGAVPLRMAKKNPQLQPIEDSWGFLTEQEKAHILTLVDLYARQRRTKTRNKNAQKTPST